MNSPVIKRSKGAVWPLVIIFTIFHIQTSFSQVTGISSGMRAAGPEEVIIGGDENPLRAAGTATRHTRPAVHHLFKTHLKFGDIRIEAFVEDAGRVKAVTLYYRGRGAREFIGTKMKHISGNTYTGVIPEKALSQGGIEYYIEAAARDGGTGSDGSDKIPYFASITGGGGAVEKTGAKKGAGKSNWWKWALGAAVIGGAAAVAAASGSSDNSGSGGAGGGASDTGKVTGTWR